jgi:hypothetical protein
MTSEALYTRDLLYDSGAATDPGIIHVSFLQPDSRSKLPVIIEEKTKHNPLKHIQNIIDIICAEILNRVRIDVRRDVALYLKSNGEIKKEYGTPYIRVYYEDNKLCFEGVDTPE